MFGKQVLEVCTIVTYWVLFVPSLLVWLQLKIDNKPFDYFFSHSDYALYLILGYLVIYRIVLYIFIKLKTFDLRLWHTLPDTKAKLELELEETKSYYETLDHMDGPSLLYGSRILKKSAPSTPRPPHTPRFQRSPATKAELELELDKELPYSPYYPDLDQVDGPSAILSYESRTANRRALSTLRPPHTPRLQRSPAKAELQSELPSYQTVDLMEGPSTILPYESRVPNRKAPPSPHTPRTPPAINVEHVAEIYECPPK